MKGTFMKYTEMITSEINSFPELEIIDSKNLYLKKFHIIPEAVFFKVLSRLTQEKSLTRLTSGVYCKPKVTRFGLIDSSEKHIVSYYLGRNHNSGVVLGYHLFNKYRLTTQISKNVEMVSTLCTSNVKNIKNVKVKKINFTLNTRVIKLIELLYVLENYEFIEDLNYNNLISFIKESLNYFDETSLEKVIKNLKPKKRVLASLKEILNYFDVKHSLNKHLSSLSNYNSVDIVRLYELTSG
jgi:hypothetical protein